MIHVYAEKENCVCIPARIRDQIPPRPHSTVPTTQFLEYLLGKVREVTAKSYVKRVRLLAKLGDIEQPEEIKSIICAYPCSEARKELLTNAYGYYCEFKGYQWIKPHFTGEDK